MSGAGARWTLLRDHRVRWSECDPYAHMNHTAYLTLFEDLRVAHWLALAGTSVGRDRAGPVVASVEVRYLRPVHFGDAVRIGLRTASFRRASLVHDYALWRGEEACCTARALLVVVRPGDGAKVPLDGALRAALRAEGAAEEG